MAEKKYLDLLGLQRVAQDIAAKYAPLDSPALVGVPTAPTAATGTATTQVATTEFVHQEIASIATAIVFRGVVADVAHLPVIADEVEGNMYNVTAKGETTADFVEGTGKVLDAGSNVVVVNIKTGVDYRAVVPVGDEDPSEEGWYEYDGSEYTLSADTEVDGSKTYYEQYDVMSNKWDILGGVFDVSELEAQINVRLTFGETMPQSPEDGDTFLYLGDTSYTYDAVSPVGTENPQEEGWYVEDTLNPGQYVLTTDTEVQVGTTYYEKNEEFVQGVIYKYDEATTSWEAKTAGDTMVEITNAEIDQLFA